MIFIHKSYSLKIIYLILILVTSFYSKLTAQKPPRPITIFKTADLSFGAFYQGTGGTVNVSTAGSRSPGGDVVLLGLGYIPSAAVFRITGNPGTMFTFSVEPEVTLTGSNGGSMKLQPGPTDPISPVILNDSNHATFDLYVGGRLEVGDPLSSPPGSYTGSFTITFNQN